MDTSLGLQVLNSIGVICAIIGVFYGIFRNSKKDKEKYVTKVEMKAAIKEVNEKTDLKIEIIHQSLEENKALFEYMKEGLDYIRVRVDKLAVK